MTLIFCGSSLILRKAESQVSPVQVEPLLFSCLAAGGGGQEGGQPRAPSMLLIDSRAGD